MTLTRSKATVFVFLASIIWGATFVAQRIAGDSMEAFTYNGVRFALGSLALLPVIILYEKTDPAKTRRTWYVGLAGGLVLFFGANLQQLGIVLSDSSSSASEAGFITGLYTVLVPIFGLALGRKTSVFTWVGAVLAFGGLALISTGPEGLASVQTSDLFLVAGAVFWAVHILLIDRYVHEIHPLRFAAVQFAVCSALSMAAAFAFETVSLDGIRAGIVPILFGGLLSSGVAYTLQIFGQRKVAPAKAAIIFSLEAVFAALSEAVLLGELMTPRKYIGASVIFAAIILSQRNGRRRATK